MKYTLLLMILFQIYVYTPNKVDAKSLEIKSRGQNMDDFAAIVDGQEAQNCAWPAMAHLRAIRKNEPNSGIQYFCGGILITARHVLTAAHCITDSFENFVESTLEIALGTHYNTSDANQDAKNETNVIIAYPRYTDFHPNFTEITCANNSVLMYDIGVITLRSDVANTDGVPPVPLINYGSTPTQGNATLLGWSYTNVGNNSNQIDVLKETKLKILPFDSCLNFMKRCLNYVDVNEGDMICAGGYGLTKGCDGDSGGPLLYHDDKKGRWFLIGILSFGNDCTATPNIYTRVESYLPWINGILNRD